MSQVLREAYQLRLGFFVVQRFMKNSLVLNMHGSLSAKMSHQNDAMSHQNDAMSHHFWENVTSLLRKCRIKVKHCHITLAFLGIFGTRRVYLGGQGEIPSDQKRFVIQNAYLAKPEFSALSWLMASGGEVGERTLVYWKSRFHLQVICLNWYFNSQTTDSNSVIICFGYSPYEIHVETILITTHDAYEK